MKASLQPSTKLQNTSLVDKNYHIIHLHIPSLTLILPLPKLHAVHFRSIFSNPPNHPITSLGHPPSSSPSLVQTPKPADHRRDPTPSFPRGLPGWLEKDEQGLEEGVCMGNSFAPFVRISYSVPFSLFSFFSTYMYYTQYVYPINCTCLPRRALLPKCTRQFA